MIKILIVDDHTIFRQGLKRIVEDTPDIVIVGEAETAQEALNLLRKEYCDVMVLDLTLPDKSGLDVLKELRQERPKLPVLVLTMHSEDQYAVRVLKAGASGYLNKGSAPEELICAIKKVYRGGKYVSSHMAERLVSELDINNQKALHEKLSDREYQVLRLIGSGKTISEIAGILSLSVTTISTYRARILEKMEMKTSAELTRYAIENGLIDE
jgi:two-component system, NarL family, invasion response regulator UvrY